MASGIRIDPSPRWVRTVRGGVTIASSKRMKLLCEPGKLPVYYFPQEDVRMDLLTPMEDGLYALNAGGERIDAAAWSRSELPGHIAFDWNSMDAWYEEDDEIFVHPRDPYKRVDVLRSSRHVQVKLGDVTIADTRRPSLLFETNMPTRYYIPRMDVRMDLLIPSASHTRCPYKGVASYWSATIHGKTYKDIVWSYQVPIPECPKIEQLMCFFNERVDAMYVDGELQEKPQTKWSVEPA
jgi:uncharacterized protein (DUF427 family)